MADDPIDAGDYRAAETLKDGTAVLIRGIRPDDAAAVAAGFEHFGPESRHHRFFAAKAALTAEELERVTHPETENALRLVAQVIEGLDAGRLVGGASCIVDPAADPERGEIAFSIIDPYQGRGLGARLLRHLAALARERGIRSFTATVLPENAAMLAVFEKSGLPMERESEGEHLRVALSLA